MLAKQLVVAGLGALLAAGTAGPVAAQISVVSDSDGVRAGELQVPVNKSQVLRVDRPYGKALVGNPDIADVLPLTERSLYVLGKKVGTTSLTLYDRHNMLIAVVDVSVGPDVITLRRQLGELMPGDHIGARMSNDSIILDGIVSSGPAADRAVQIAETFAPGKVVNLLSVGSAQQVMLEVRFSEMNRTIVKQFGLNHTFFNGSGKFVGGIGDNGLQGVPSTTTTGTTSNGISSSGSTTSRVGSGALDLLLPTAGFGAFGVLSHIAGLNISSALDALEQKGLATTLAEPTLVALSGETASFLAGGEFPIPVAQGSTASTGGGGFSAVTVQFKPFGVSISFTPTVLADGVINLVVAPEVSSLDASAAVVINGFRVPGLRTRRAKTTVELRDGESFAIAGLLSRDFSDTVRQVPLLGSIPIIGALFRSTGFQRGDTELVMIVTPRLVRPVPSGTLKVPTDRVAPPSEADLFLLGHTDKAVPPGPTLNRGPIGEPSRPELPPPPRAGTPGGMSGINPKALEKDYGHVL